MKPILFNTEMVKTILDSRKTQARIPIKLNIKKDNEAHSLNGTVFTVDNKLYFEHNLIEKFSKYKVGDVLYVREKSYFVDCDCQCPWQCYPQSWYATDTVSYSSIRCSIETIPSIHMRKENSRIFLKITKVRVERLKNMTFNDIRKEGIFPLGDITEDSNNYISHIQELWLKLWNSTVKDGYKWEDNPYVFVYEFEKIKSKEEKISKNITEK